MEVVVVSAVRTAIAETGDVVFGNCFSEDDNLARVAALQAGLPVDMPGLTIDRQCGSLSEH